MPQLPPGGTAFDGGDPVIWAKLPPGGQDHTDNHAAGSHSYRETWLLRLSAPNVSTAQIRASKRIPAEGFPLYQHAPATDPTLLGTYMRAVDGFDAQIILDANAVVVNRDVRKDGDPYYAEVVIAYEGIDDPTAEPPDVQDDYVTFQEHLTWDVNGKPVMNSAFDPIDGGMPSEGFLKRFTITRNLLYSAWNQKKGDNYIKSINSKDFVLSGQLEGGQPVKYPFGYCLIDNIRTQRVLQKRGVGTANTYYWRVTADILVDLRTVRLPDGTRIGRAHRYVVPDAGYHEFAEVEAGPPAKWGKKAVHASTQGSSSPQLLNGKGGALLPRNRRINPIEFNPHLRTSALGGLVPDFYACEGGGAFTVTDANGVLANDTDPLVTSVVAVDTPAHSSSFTLNSAGGFSYTPAAGYVGWDSFTYKPTGALDSAKQWCQILVGASPVLLFFDAYRYADWSGLAVLLEGW